MRLSQNDKFRLSFWNPCDALTISFLLLVISVLPKFEKILGSNKMGQKERGIWACRPLFLTLQTAQVLDQAFENLQNTMVETE